MGSKIIRVVAASAFLLPGIAKVLLLLDEERAVGWIAIGLVETWLGVGLLMAATRSWAAWAGLFFCAAGSVYGWSLAASDTCLCFGKMGELGRSGRLVYLGVAGLFCAWLALGDRAVSERSAGAPA